MVVVVVLEVAVVKLLLTLQKVVMLNLYLETMLVVEFLSTLL